MSADAVGGAEVGLVGDLHGGDEELVGEGRDEKAVGGRDCRRRLPGGRRRRFHGALPHGGDGGTTLPPAKSLLPAREVSASRRSVAWRA